MLCFLMEEQTFPDYFTFSVLSVSMTENSKKKKKNPAALPKGIKVETTKLATKLSSIVLKTFDLMSNGLKT